MNSSLKQIINNASHLLSLITIKLRTPSFSRESHVQIKSANRLFLGKNVVIQRDSILHCGGKKWCNFSGKIILDDNVVIGPKCIVYGTGDVHIGEYSHLGPGVIVMSQSGLPTDNRLTTHPDITFEPIRLGKGCWIGAGTVILGNTTLGDSCTVGPNSVVKGDYPDNTVLIGNPARASARI